MGRLPSVSKVRYIWQITPNEHTFCRWARDGDKIKYWFFKTRELAEAAAAPIVEQDHRDYVKERIWYSKQPEGRDELDKEDIKWWLSKPELRLIRTKTTTTYMVGHPERDRRGKQCRNYGEIRRVKVLTQA